MRAPAVDPVPPGSLGAIERLVGAPEEIGNLDLGTPGTKGSDANAASATGDAPLWIRRARKQRVTARLCIVAICAQGLRGRADKLFAASILSAKRYLGLKPELSKPLT
jgi:hypothetical protein